MVETSQGWKTAALTFNYCVRLFVCLIRRFFMNDIDYMREAYAMARKAFERDEVPIGAIVVCNNEIIGRGYNQKIGMVSPIRHAEIVAIEDACRKIGDWRLDECTLYVTLEPCPMCKGAIVESRISRVVYATKRDKPILDFDTFGDSTIVDSVEFKECATILSDFFAKKRLK